MKTLVDYEAARELELYAKNTRDVYVRMTMPVISNMVKKQHKGIYDKKKAVKAWEYVVEYAAKLYHKEFCGRGKWYDTFNAATRREAAKHIEEGYYNEYINV